MRLDSGWDWDPETRRRFTFHPAATPGRAEEHEAVCARCGDLSAWLRANLPDCPERDKAIDAVDLAQMQANAAIARQG